MTALRLPIVTTPGGKRLPLIWTRTVRPENDQRHGVLCGCARCEHGGKPAA